MATTRFFIYLLAVSAILLLLNTNPTRGSGEKHAGRSLFVFGDSLFDVGNNNYFPTTFRVNHWPYGETYFKLPTGRASDGRIIPDFIAEFAKLPLIPPYLQPALNSYTNGVNFASGGAGALQETNNGSVIALKTQLSNFKNVEEKLRHKLGGEEAKRLLSQSVYIFSIGTNDYLSPLASHSTLLPLFHSNKQAYVDMVIGNLTYVVKEIYNRGGSKFGFLNLGRVGCFPKMRDRKPGREGACTDKVTTMVKLHNRKLSKVLSKLERRLKGFKYSMFDFYTCFGERLNDPSKYGFKEEKMACCGAGPYRGNSGSCGGEGIKYELCENPSDYLFFDPAHPTEAADKQFAMLMWSGNSHITGPHNLRTLFQL
ncbi:hypothetical protein FNV43_RR08072 [Rhamnella rubrinervis]|uniref:GDSL esterase/lipase 1-like n=1 Tax=Rhamnella rubrinervis TaxID=2594499 RepID=A0A8K0HGF9_9ROSA|nr:hypothetical protein FNV43_RR08072 [Rhamnella rubrinervis]